MQQVGFSDVIHHRACVLDFKKNSATIPQLETEEHIGKEWG